MPVETSSDSDKSTLEKRRVGCMVTFINPFRIVDGPESAPLGVTVEDVNHRTWDYVALHEIVGGVDVGLPAPYHMVLARDGAIALPPLSHLRNDQEAVEFFNRCLAAMLLGGVYCEAINLDGLDFGSIIDWKYVRLHSSAPAAANRFHNSVRLQKASPLEAIGLCSPRNVSMAEVSKAVSAGRAVLDAVPKLSGEFLLKGVTGIARRDWGTALANLWIAIEQISSWLWDFHVLKPAKTAELIPGRADQLSDPRTWTMAARHELMHQIGVLSHETFKNLSLARKARNELSHKGIHPTGIAAEAAFDAVKELLVVTVPDSPIPLLSLDISDHGLSDPFKPHEPEKIEPTHWMEIPKLPGEADLERLEANNRRGRQGNAKPS